ncbi:MAG: cell division protein SepF [Lachnospiraceae bacterium]|nr:cell division protein SepF [Lachnospiraceae bacterium]
MSIMDKMINKMSLNEDPDDDYLYDDEYDEEEEEEVKPKKSLFSKPETSEEEEYEEAPRPALRSLRKEKVTPMRQPKRGADGMEVCVIKPVNVEDSREITDTLLSDRTVVLNLEGLDVDIAQRIIDFTSGSCYAMKGNLQKISHYIFIITPASVDISGDFQDILAGTFDVPSIHSEG